MNHNKKAIGMCLICASLSFFAVPAMAEDATPVTRCVTAATKATYATVTARMEKDIEPYAKEPKAEAAIKAYRETMAIAWGAMEEPYCGYGNYGIASSVKSYNKNVERARAAFLAAVKGIAKAKTVAVAVAPAEKVKIEETKPATKEIQKKLIKSGLRKGIRSAAVLDLQKKLAEHFEVPLDSDWLTGYFGPVTLGYVLKFQKEKGIIANEKSPGAGLVGPKTAGALNQL